MYASRVKRPQLTLATLFSCCVAACGGIVNFAPPDEDDPCADKTCGDACGDGGTCSEDGTCSFGDVLCPPLCVLGSCGDVCSICVGEDCVQGLCSEEGVCVEGGVPCPL